MTHQSSCLQLQHASHITSRGACMAKFNTPALWSWELNCNWLLSRYLILWLFYPPISGPYAYRKNKQNNGAKSYLMVSKSKERIINRRKFSVHVILVDVLSYRYNFYPCTNSGADPGASHTPTINKGCLTSCRQGLVPLTASGSVLRDTQTSALHPHWLNRPSTSPMDHYVRLKTSFQL